MGCSPSPGRAESPRRPGAQRWLLKAKLVALRVCHDDPILPALLHRTQLGRSDTTEPLHRRLDVQAPVVEGDVATAADVEVEMDAILDHLGFRHLLEVEARAAPLGINEGARGVPLVLSNPLRGQVRGPG